MKNYIKPVERLANKTAESRITNYFEERYKFSPVVSECLSKDTLFFNTVFSREQRADGQTIYYAVSNTERAGKRLKDCEYEKVKLTIRAEDDLQYREQHGLKELKLRIIRRICEEAVLQEACLTYEDIAELLFLDRTTVGIYIDILQRRGQYIQTRANFTDQGRKFTHKEQIIKLFLMRLSNTEIAQRTNHHLTSVENYIREFLRVSLLHQERKTEPLIAQLTRKSLSLIKEYIALYRKLEGDDYFKGLLVKKILFYRADMQSDLTGFNTSPFKKKILEEVRI